MAFSKVEDGKYVPFEEKWSIFCRMSGHLFIMVRHSITGVIYAPLYRHSFQLLQPHFLMDAEKFNITYTDPSMLTTTADKLRYFRYKKALLQRNVADYAGIERTTYSAYEENTRDYYPLDVLVRIAELLGVEIIYLLDDYNAFLYRGQAEQIKGLRKQLELTQAAFAVRFNVNTAMVKRWEQEKTRMTKKMWAKIFIK